MGSTIAIATVALTLHSLSAVVWVGGMFFAHQILRPAASPLEPGLRFELWMRVLSRFFVWVFVAILVLLASGYAMIYGVFAGFAGTGLHVQLMMGIGILMMLIFLHLYFAPWRRFQSAVAGQDWALAGRQLGQIRVIVGINLVLGLVTVAIGSSGRYWG